VESGQEGVQSGQTGVKLGPCWEEGGNVGHNRAMTPQLPANDSTHDPSATAGKIIIINMLMPAQEIVLHIQ
jgi:hypothetical protein